MISGLAVVLAALVAMEGVSYSTHRWVMHGFGIGIHRSHHAVRDGAFERNDLYPLMASSLAVLSFAFGTALPSARLLEIGIGMTLYGMSYLFVHEIYIHRRLPFSPPPLALFEWLRDSHRIHHLYGGEPFGMLLPIVPRALREKAAAAIYDPLTGSVSSGPANAPRPVPG